MYSFDFKAKLRQLNDSLFVDDSFRSHIHDDFYVSPLYLNKAKRSDKLLASEMNQLTSDARKYIEAYDAGLLPEKICSVPTSWIPEYDRFAAKVENGKVTATRYVARGWRTVLIILASKGIIRLEKARHVFNCPGLGLDTYDRLTRDQKQAWAIGARDAK